MSRVNDSANAIWSWDTALCGVVPPLISPLDSGGHPDGPAVLALVEHILGAGCTGLFVLGGCGEGAWLTFEQRTAMVRKFTKAAGGRVAVLVGVMLPATGPTLEAAKAAADEGADALVIGSPYYISVDAATQQRHVEAILDAVSLPVLLYNIPQATHSPLSPVTVARLARDQRVIGVKDSAGDFESFQGFLAIKKWRPDFRLLQGYEPLAAASLLQGADGLVPGMANLVPALYVALHRAAKAGDTGTSARLQEAMTDLCTLYAQGHWLPALKAACAMLGFGNGVPSLPLLPASEEQRRAIKAILSRHGLPDAKLIAP